MGCEPRCLRQPARENPLLGLPPSRGGRLGRTSSQVRRLGTCPELTHSTIPGSKRSPRVAKSTEARAIGTFYFLKKGQSGRNLSGEQVSWDISRWSLQEGTTKLPLSLGTLAPSVGARRSPPSKDEHHRGGRAVCLACEAAPMEGARGDSSLQAGGGAAANSWGSACIPGSVLRGR